MSTCTICNESYKEAHKDQIISKLPKLQTDSTDICLSCYQLEIRRIKSTYTPELKELKPIMEEAKATYHKLYKEWSAIAEQYRKYDYNDMLITHQKLQQEKRLAEAQAYKDKQSAKTKKPSKKPVDEKALVLNILKNLSESQRASLLAKMSEQ